MEEVTIEKLEWTILEHEQKEHTVDWFWAVGLITIVSCGIALWFANYIFAIFIFISGCCLILITIRKPQRITFTVDSNGITMGKNLYPWKDIKDFNVKNNDNYDKLFIQIKKHFLPVYTINLPKDLTQKINGSIL